MEEIGELSRGLAEMMKPLRRQHWRHHCSINWFDFAIRNQDRRNLSRKQYIRIFQGSKVRRLFRCNDGPIIGSIF